MAKILIIDDSAFARKAIARQATALGHEAIEACEGMAGLKIIAAEDIDCVTLDMVMPGLDGLNVLQKIKRQFPELPVIIMTADIQTETRDECLQAGALVVLNKPAQSDEVRQAFQQALNGETVS